ncbi:hypothetical protein [Sorangium sp. So ce388]|uniref:hypothetical protein n=1 Tax=Sorangium sp. So ce388 TaxID=3133309 RepID=UPI003F5B3A7F
MDESSFTREDPENEILLVTDSSGELVSFTAEDLHGIARFVVQTQQGTPLAVPINKGRDASDPIPITEIGQLLWLARNRGLGGKGLLYVELAGTTIEASLSDSYVRPVSSRMGFMPFKGWDPHRITYDEMRHRLASIDDNYVTDTMLRIHRSPQELAEPLIAQLAMMLNYSESSRNLLTPLCNAALLNLGDKLMQGLDHEKFKWSQVLNVDRSGLVHPMTGGGRVKNVRDGKLGGIQGTPVYRSEVNILQKSILSLFPDIAHAPRSFDYRRNPATGRREARPVATNTTLLFRDWRQIKSNAGSSTRNILAQGLGALASASSKRLRFGKPRLPMAKHY